jgi:hypothetical protein
MKEKKTKKIYKNLMTQASGPTDCNWSWIKATFFTLANNDLPQNNWISPKNGAFFKKSLTNSITSLSPEKYKMHNRLREDFKQQGNEFNNESSPSKYSRT